MAKSIRSKTKRKNRSEFRNTIGTDVAKANMAVVQAKLQECIHSGQMNSFDRLSNLFSGRGSGNSNNDTDNDAGANNGGDDDVRMTAAGRSEGGKDPSKLPAKKSKSHKHQKLTGQYGDKTSRKVGDKKYRRGRVATARGDEGRGRSQGRNLDGRRARSSSKKGRGGSRGSAMAM